RLVVNTIGSEPCLLASVSLVMLLRSAETNTSAGAPSAICAARSEDPAKLNVTSASGLAAVNAAPSSVKASESDAAANTTISPAASESAVPAPSSPPQPTNANTT